MSAFNIRLVNNNPLEVAAVLDIYRHYVDTTAISFEYSAPSLEEYQKKIAHVSEKYPWLICMDDDKVAGFAYASTHRDRTAYQWSAESSIYIAPPYQGKGIGRILYSTLFAVLKLQGYYNVFAGVALPNDQSLRFHRDMLFEEIGIFKNIGFKLGSWHHTQWFRLALQDLFDTPAPPLPMKDVIDSVEWKNIFATANESFKNSQ